jgi:hypothetical protein
MVQSSTSILGSWNSHWENSHSERTHCLSWCVCQSTYLKGTKSWGEKQWWQGLEHKVLQRPLALVSESKLLQMTRWPFGNKWFIDHLLSTLPTTLAPKIFRQVWEPQPRKKARSISKTSRITGRAHEVMLSIQGSRGRPPNKNTLKRFWHSYWDIHIIITNIYIIYIHIFSCKMQQPCCMFLLILKALCERMANHGLLWQKSSAEPCRSIWLTINRSSVVRMVFRWTNKNDDELIDLAFNKKRADDRKASSNSCRFQCCSPY